MERRDWSQAYRRWALLALSLGGLWGCDGTNHGGKREGHGSTDTPDASHPSPSGPQTFESDFPASSNGGGAGLSASAPEANAGGAADTSTSSKDVSAERTIVEADIVQIAGNRLYALSRVAGLSVIDVSNPAKLKILGRYRYLPGQPFEMYLRDTVAVIMFTNWGQYAKQGDDYVWVQTSKVLALDVSDPTQMSPLSSFDIPGEVSDSRIVGDALYVVGYQNNGCWGCNEKPLTSITSLDVKDPHSIRKVDELTYVDSDNQYGWGQRSVTVTTDRMYVAGPEYSAGQVNGSTIQIVDISDPAGDLVEGTSVQAAGMISSRWQMDEYQGVLRVISQTPVWNSAQLPQIQTFHVTSSQKLEALASVDLQLPSTEQLQSVRFDGPRGYAVTSRQTDPLFTIDLSNPSAPKQVGAVYMPGYLYYMQPHGDRLIGLGFDQGNSAGGITVSLFDVSDLSAPSMIKRVNFGGTWGSLPEDQDRIHKAFKVLDSLQLILVPFSGWSGWTDDKFCDSPYRSGVQLVDFIGDDLTLRGMAPSRGEARRALILNDDLLTVSDESVEAYDLSDRDHPQSLKRLAIANYVIDALPLTNTTAARVNQDWYSNSSWIDLVNMADVARPDVSVGSLDLSESLGQGKKCDAYAWIQDVYPAGQELDVLYSTWEYASGQYQERQGVVVVDASQPSTPKITSTLAWPRDDWYPFYGYYDYGFTGSQVSVIRTGKAMAQLEQTWVQSNPGQEYTNHMRLRVVDLRDPKNPSQTTLTLPNAAGYAGLVADGEDLLLSHYETGNDPDHVRFYVDRVDLTDPSAPTLVAKINVPGALLHLDRASGRIITSELVRKVVDGIKSSDCYDRFGYASFAQDQTTSDAGSDPVGTCTGFLQSLNLVRFVDGGAVLEDTLTLGEAERIASSGLSAGRMVATISNGWGWGWGYATAGVAIDCFGPCGYGGVTASKPAQVLVLSGFDQGSFTQGHLSVDDLSHPWWGFWGAPTAYAVGTQALLTSYDEVAVLDLSDPAHPALARSEPLFGYLSSVHVNGDTALLALGQDGVQTVNLR